MSAEVERQTRTENMRIQQHVKHNYQWEKNTVLCNVLSIARLFWYTFCHLGADAKRHLFAPREPLRDLSKPKCRNLRDVARQNTVFVKLVR